ncbi:MAG: hypothetical protein CMH56_16685, partial [Myxococcales bacterium]|nr:hypothetical protein [Myxococcales bacterium]
MTILNSLSGCGNFVAGPPEPPKTEPACVFDADCPNSQSCVNGACVGGNLPILGLDGGPTIPGPSSSQDASVPQAILELSESGALEFGAQRLGVSVERALQLSNVGTLPLDIVHIVINNDTQNEFQATPSGTLNQELRPGEVLEMVIEHTPKDATADFAMLQVVHSGAGGIAQLELQAEFKGTPALWAGTDVSDTESTLITELDLGELPVGSATSKKIYLRNMGAIDSIIALTDFNVSPITGAFDIFPEDLEEDVFLSSFIENCDNDAACPSSHPICDQSICFNNEGEAASTVQVEVFFAPQGEGEHDGILSILGYDNNDEDVAHDIALSGTGLVGQLAADPTLVVFDDAYIGYPQQRTVTLENVGQADLILTELTWGTGLAFEITGPSLPLTLTPNAGVDVVIGFLANGLPGLAEDVLTATTETEDDTQIQVRADVTPPPGLSISLLGEEDLEPIDLDTTLSLPNTYLGQQKVSYLVITNTGDSPLRIDGISFSADSSEKFSLGAMPAFPATLTEPYLANDAGPLSASAPTDAGIAGDDYLFIPVMYQGDALNVDDSENLVADLGTLTVTSSDPANGTLQVNLDALTIDPQPFFNDLTPFPLTMPHTSEPTTQTLTITNAGYGPLVLDNLIFPEESPFELTLPADLYEPLDRNESRDIAITFNPTAATVVEHTLQLHFIYEPENLRADFILSGESEMGVITFSPSALDFGLVFISRSHELSFTVENTGNVDVPFETISIGGGDHANAFALVNAQDWPDGTVLAVDESRTMTLRYAPFSGGATATVQNAQVSFMIDAISSFPQEAHPQMNINGSTQWLPSVAVFDDSLGSRLDANGTVNLDFGDVPIGTQHDSTIRLRNLGLGDLHVAQACFLDVISNTCSEQTSFAQFTFSPLGIPPDIPSNNDQPYVITFAPQTITLNGDALATTSAVMRIETYDPDTPYITVNLVARPTNPIYSQNPNTYDFGGIYPGQLNTSSDLVITNTGYGALIIESIELSDSSPNDFDLPNFDLPVTLQHDDTFTFNVDYTPNNYAADSGAIVISYFSDMARQGIITITGEGENCPDGKRDINGDPQDGCECAPTPNQGNTCFHPNANTGCDANGYCVFDSCLEGWHNLDGDLANGCEYQCTPFSQTDVPDSLFLDANCDGIAGDLLRGVFVATDGNDTPIASGGGTAANPMKTISYALDQSSLTRDHIYVASGIYNEQIELMDGVSIWGGFARSINPENVNTGGWDRSTVYTTQIKHDEATSGRVIAMKAVNITSTTTVGDLDIEAKTSNQTGVSIYGVYCNNCDALSLQRNHIMAGGGGNGSSGTDGDDGAELNNPTLKNGGAGGGGSCDGSSYGAGGSAGQSACSRPGGSGGRGGTEGSNSGVSGSNGTWASNGGGSGGGAGGGGTCGPCGFACLSSCGCPGDGQNGQPGDDGDRGTDGSSASQGGSISGGYWLGKSGNPGTNGSNGHGGGGGGGGGGQGGGCVNDGSGNGGGGGGGGGCYNK